MTLGLTKRLAGGLTGELTRGLTNIVGNSTILHLSKNRSLF
jgi:hypothetical protein